MKSDSQKCTYTQILSRYSVWQKWRDDNKLFLVIKRPLPVPLFPTSVLFLRKLCLSVRLSHHACQTYYTKARNQPQTMYGYSFCACRHTDCVPFKIMHYAISLPILLYINGLGDIFSDFIFSDVITAKKKSSVPLRWYWNFPLFHKKGLGKSFEGINFTIQTLEILLR